MPLVRALLEGAVPMKYISLGLLLLAGTAELACSSDPGTQAVTGLLDGGYAGFAAGRQSTGGAPGVGGAAVGRSGSGALFGGLGGAGASSGLAGALGSSGAAGASGPFGFAGVPASSGGAFATGGTVATGGGVPSFANGGATGMNGNGGVVVGGSSSGGVPIGVGGSFPAAGGRPPGNGGARSTGGSSSVCAPSVDHRCNGAELQICRPDGLGYQDQKPCVSAALCHADTGTCAPPTCTPSTKSCDGNSLRTCNADGTGYVGSTLCPTTCDPNTNTCEICAPGATACDGNSSVTCDPTGHTMTKTPCAKVCVGQGVCGDCDPAFAQRDCPVTDPCQVPSCNANTNKCEFKLASLHDTCSMRAGYGDCTAGGCLGFCTDRNSCDPIVVIKANVNGQYVTLTSDGYLLANATSKANAARFALHVDPRNRAYEMAFYSMDVHSYVAVDALTVPLEIGAGAIDTPEAFTNLDANGNEDPTGALIGVTMTFWSAEVSKYVTAEDAGASPLIANRDAIGPWEQFTLEFASP